MKRTISMWSFLASALVWIIFPGFIWAVTFNVTSSQDEVDVNIGDCVCLTASQTCTLRAAIQEANACQGDDTINLLPNIYTMTIPGAGEDGAATGDLDITANLTIIGNDQTDTIIDSNSIDRVFHVIGSITLSIQKVTIKRGVAYLHGGPLSNGWGWGGGIYSEGDLTLINVAVQDNIGNGVMASFNGQGGGIYNAGTLSLIESHVEGNQAIIGGSYGAGGGIYNIGTANIATGNINRNWAGSGGGIYNSSNLTIVDTAFDQNSVDLGVGGGIFNSGTLVLEKSLITRGGADAGGGLLNTGTGVADLTNVTLSNIRANGYGGAISNGNPFAGSETPSISLKNATIHNNRATTQGGGLYSKSGGTVTLKSTIVSNSVAGGNCAGVITSQGHNLDSGTTCGFSNPDDLINTDPKLGPLQNNGGPTLTHALPLGSPAIEHGDNAGCPATDQRGVARPNGAVCDIGAFEFVPQLFLPLILKSS